MKLSIIIPVFNEIKTITRILEKIQKVNLNDVQKEIIIIDDGSTDGTTQFLNKIGSLPKNHYTILFHNQNYGKGYAIRTALKKVTGDYIIIQDADLEYDPQDYKKILECAIKNNAEVVYGSRHSNLSSKNKYSYLSFYLGGIFLTWLTNILYGTRIIDESTCYKLFRTETLKNINLKCTGFEFCPEVTAKIAKKGIKIYEVPINYYPRHKKEGKKIKWEDGVRALWTLIKYKFID